MRQLDVRVRPFVPQSKKLSLYNAVTKAHPFLKSPSKQFATVLNMSPRAIANEIVCSMRGTSS